MGNEGDDRFYLPDAFDLSEEEKKLLLELLPPRAWCLLADLVFNKATFIGPDVEYAYRIRCLLKGLIPDRLVGDNRP